MKSRDSQAEDVTPRDDPSAAYERFRALTENSFDLVAELDPRGVLRYVSPNHHRVLGWRPEELVGHPVLEFLHPDDRDVVLTTLAAGLAGHDPERVDFRFRHVDGSWRWCESTGQSFRTASGEPRAVVVTRDITARRAAEQDLARSQRELAARNDSLGLLHRLAEDAYRQLSPDEVATNAVATLGALTAYPMIALYSVDEDGVKLLAGRGIPRKVAQIMRNPRPPGGLAKLALDERRVVSAETPFLDPRVVPEFREFLGSIGAASLTLVPLLYQDAALGVVALASHSGPPQEALEIETLRSAGRIVAGALVNARHVARIEREVEERRQAEQSLAAVNDVASTLSRCFGLRAVGDAITRTISAYSGFEQDVLYLIDEQTEQVTPVSMHGFPLADSEQEFHTRMQRSHAVVRSTLAMGRRPLVLPELSVAEKHAPELVGPLLAAGVVSAVVLPLRFQDRLVGCLNLGSRQRREVSPARLDTLLAMAQSAAAALEHALHVERLRAAIREREAAEQALRDSEVQLQQAQKMEALGLLAGGISHDFNNLLTVITGYAEMLRDETGRPDPDLSGAEEILRASERAMALTRQLLTFSRKQVVQPRLVDPNAVVSELQSMLRRVLGETIELDVALDPSVGVVLADPGQLSQIVVNLAVNARDAMPGGGVLRIRSAEVDGPAGSGAAPPARHVRLSVTDTGAGVPPEIHERIFEPFFTTKEPGRGTGLGLSTVYGIVQQSGGEIRLESAPGRGATFHVDLPRAGDRSLLRAAGPRARDAAAGRETVLLVEDEDAVRRLAQRVLRSRGYRVLEAADGGEALALLRRQREDVALLITDVVMPDMSGPELAQQAELEGIRLPILFISGYPQESVAQLSNLPRGASFLSKPFTPRVFADRVRELLDGVHG